MTARELQSGVLTFGKAARILGSELPAGNSGDEPLPARFTADSRQIMPGDGFIAIKGAINDGHDYIKSAVQNGASAVLLERGYFEAHRDELRQTGAAFITAADPVTGAAKLARSLLEEVSPKTVGVTGSAGKTTTREFLKRALEGNFKTHAAIKSYNTLIGVSLTILAMPADTEILILEIGTNHPGEIREIVTNFPISHGVITEVSDAHLEGLGSIEGVLAAKMEITESAALEFLSYNFDNNILSAAVAAMSGGEGFKKDGIRQIGVGYSNSGVRISDVRQVMSGFFEPQLFVTLAICERKLACAAPLFGKQHARNIGFAYAVASQMGLEDKMFAEAAKSFAVPSGRGVIKRGKNGCALIDETYNANPTSMSHAIKNLLEMEIPEDFKRVAILGGMRELGGETERLHEVALSRVALLDEVYLIGNEWEAARKKPRSVRGIWRSAEDFADDFDINNFGGSVILLKGSRHYELEKLIELLEAYDNAD